MTIFYLVKTLSLFLFFGNSAMINGNVPGLLEQVPTKITSITTTPTNVYLLKDTSIDTCSLADNCHDIQDAQTLNTAPTDLACSQFPVRSLVGCLENASPEDSISSCGFQDHPTVWFKINTDEQARQLHTFVSTAGSWQPVWAVFYGDCNDLTQVTGGSIDAPAQCSHEDFNPNSHAIWLPTGPDGTIIKTYYVAVTSLDGNIDNPEFTLSAFTQSDCVSCIGDDVCESKAKFSVISRSSGRPLNDPVFCQGEAVSFCFEFYYDPSETGVDWFHSVIPDFGNGWDMSSFEANSVTTSPEGAQWFGPESGDCAPYVTETMPLICSYTDEHGQLKLCNIKCGFCPCTTPMDSSSMLPGGWYWVSPGGEGCENTCNPSSSYGYPGSNVGLEVQLCMTLKTKILNGQDCFGNNDLQISFTPTSDGVTGCWEDPVAECRLDVTQIGPAWSLDCTALPELMVAFENDTIFDGEQLQLSITSLDSNQTIIVNPLPNEFVSGANSYVFNGNGGVISDQLTNLSGTPQAVRYIISNMPLNSFCSSNTDTIIVLVWPPDCTRVQDKTTWPNCASANTNPVFCNLYDLESLCGEMFTETDTASAPTPLCPDGGVSNNMTWLGFIAGNGTYAIHIKVSNCAPGAGGQLGVQAGVYTDCSFKEAVFCQAECSLGDIIVPDSLFTPGQTYYLFLDGCASGYCDYTIDIAGDYSPVLVPCDDGNPETINDVYDENCVCRGEISNKTEVVTSTHYEIYPNPFTNQVFITSKDKNLNFTPILLNTCGSLLTAPIQKTEGGYTIATDHIPSGVYILKVMENEGSSTFKLVKP